MMSCDLVTLCIIKSQRDRQFFLAARHRCRQRDGPPALARQNRCRQDVALAEKIAELGELRVGDEINVEIDVVARYLDRLMAG